jgi:ABC-type polysaccharide/polyol phosphate transport system ATPase subunit
VEPIIEIKGISKKFNVWYERPHRIKKLLISILKGKPEFGHRKELTVLKDFDLDIQAGEFVGIMGRNGAGKSTLFKILSGIYQPSEGTMTVKGKVLPLIELGAGFHFDLSGYENIFLNASILGIGRKATLELLPKIIEFSELGDHIQMPIKNYSSGMLVRLGFAIASHIPGDILLIDEVLAVGDAGFQKKCLDRIAELHQAGKTIILVTHSPETVRNHCSRCVVIDHNEKIYDGEVSAGVDTYMSKVV